MSYVLREVPDPDGQLADLLQELIDNGALVPVETGGPMSDKLTEARLSETLGAVFRDAKRWADFPTDEDVEAGMKAPWLVERTVPHVARQVVREVLEAVKQEDR